MTQDHSLVACLIHIILGNILCPLVTSASIHSAELFAKEKLARFPAQHIGRAFEEEEEAEKVC